MGERDNKRGISKQKGWPGFVHGYAEYIRKADWDKITWGKRTKNPKEESRDKMGRIIQKW